MVNIFSILAVVQNTVMSSNMNVVIIGIIAIIIVLMSVTMFLNKK